jgi:hypothetical protein
MQDGGGVSHTKGWIFGYKLHLIASTNGSVIVPLVADFTTANIDDNQMYSTVTCGLPITIIRKISYIYMQILDMMIINCTISVQIYDFN